MATNDILNLELDASGDFVVDEDELGNQSFRVISGQQAIRQHIRCRVQTVLGQRLLHPTYGLDFPALETAFDENLLRGEIARAILDDPDVAEILDVTVTFDGRTRSATYEGQVRLKDDSVIGIAGPV